MSRAFPPNMPRYECRKVVAAVRVYAVQDPYILWRDDTGEVRYSSVGLGWILQHKPHAGGYLVVSSDGHWGFAPSVAFEPHHMPLRCESTENGDRCCLGSGHRGLCKY